MKTSILCMLCGIGISLVFGQVPAPHKQTTLGVKPPPRVSVSQTAKSLNLPLNKTQIQRFRTSFFPGLNNKNVKTQVKVQVQLSIRAMKRQMMQWYCKVSSPADNIIRAPCRLNSLQTFMKSLTPDQLADRIETIAFMDRNTVYREFQEMYRKYCALAEETATKTKICSSVALKSAYMNK